MQQKSTLTLIVACFLVIASIVTWWVMRQPVLLDDVDYGDARIEATELYITAGSPDHIVRIQPQESEAILTGKASGRRPE